MILGPTGPLSRKPPLQQVVGARHGYDMKKVIVFGGGTGLSCLLSGLKLFPVDVTAVITVSDDGSSTGVLKEELDIPAVGDLGKVLLSMANVDDDFVDLLGYRFEKGGSLYNHPVRNIMMAALIDLKGDLTGAAKYMSKLLNVKGSVLPLTEEKVELVGHSETEDYFGEVAVSQNIKDIDSLTYDKPFEVSSEVLERIADADLIILSPGSLYTSIIPHLIAPAVRDALCKSKAPIMYTCNLVTQPGETDGYTVGDHLKALVDHIGGGVVDFVLANNGTPSPEVLRKYEKVHAFPVTIDRKKVESLGAALIEADLLGPERGAVQDTEVLSNEIVRIHNLLSANIAPEALEDYLKRSH